MRPLVVAIALVLLPPAPAAGGSSRSDKDDKLCEAIGETPNSAVPPRDRVWFKDNCNCDPTAGCGRTGSARFRSRLAAARKRQEAAAKREQGMAEELTVVTADVPNVRPGSELADIHLKNELRSVCVRRLHELKGRGPADAIGDTKDDCDRLVAAEVGRRLAGARQVP